MPFPSSSNLQVKLPHFIAYALHPTGSWQIIKILFVCVIVFDTHCYVYPPIMICFPSVLITSYHQAFLTAGISIHYMICVVSVMTGL